MDINYLLKREQVSLWMAVNANSREARYSHRALARGYATLLAQRDFPHREAQAAG